MARLRFVFQHRDRPPRAAAHSQRVLRQPRASARLPLGVTAANAAAGIPASLTCGRPARDCALPQVSTAGLCRATRDSRGRLAAAAGSTLPHGARRIPAWGTSGFPTAGDRVRHTWPSRPLTGRACAGSRRTPGSDGLWGPRQRLAGVKSHLGLGTRTSVRSGPGARGAHGPGSGNDSKAQFWAPPYQPCSLPLFLCVCVYIYLHIYIFFNSGMSGRDPQAARRAVSREHAASVSSAPHPAAHTPFALCGQSKNKSRLLRRRR